MSLLGRMICAVDKVIRAGWCTPDDLDHRVPSADRHEVELALQLNKDEADEMAEPALVVPGSPEVRPGV